MAWIILPTVGELTSTGYGLALILKVALVVVVIALGAFNRYRLVPAVDGREQGPTDDSERSGGARRWLGNIVLAEFVLLIVAVGVTAVMVTRSPLSSVAAAAPAQENPIADRGAGRHRQRRMSPSRRAASGSTSSTSSCATSRVASSTRTRRRSSSSPSRRSTSVRYNPRSSRSASAATRRPPTSASPERGTCRSACGSTSSSRWRAAPR